MEIVLLSIVPEACSLRHAIASAASGASPPSSSPGVCESSETYCMRGVVPHAARVTGGVVD